MPNEELGDLLRAERKRRGWTQREMAKRAKIGEKTIQRMERGNIAQYDVLQRVMAALGLPIYKVDPNEEPSTLHELLNRIEQDVQRVRKLLGA